MVYMRPTPRQLWELLDYNPHTGVFVWKERPGLKAFNSRFAGKIAFTHTDSKGSKVGKLFDHPYKAHRVAFAMVHGRWPKANMCIDHINGDRCDNRIANLREVTVAVNNRNKAKERNSRTLRVGIRYRSGGWEATIKYNCRNIHLGRFDRFEDAVAARERAEAKYGFHKNHGRVA